MDAELGGLREFYDDLMAEIHSLRGQLELCSLNSGSPGNLPQDCWEAYEMGFHKSGRYTIQPRYWGAIQVRTLRRNLLKDIKKCRGGSRESEAGKTSDLSSLFLWKNLNPIEISASRSEILWGGRFRLDITISGISERYKIEYLA